MKTKTRLLVSLFCLIFSFIGLLWLILFLVIFPMFIDKIELTNKTKESIKISILREEKSNITFPMTFLIKSPAIVSPQNIKYLLSPDESVEILFDAERCYINRVVVEQKNQVKIMKIPYEYREQNSYEIHDFLLTDPTEHVFNKYIMEENSTFFYTYLLLTIVSFFGLFNIYYFIRTFRIHRSEKKKL